MAEINPPCPSSAPTVTGPSLEAAAAAALGVPPTRLPGMPMRPIGNVITPPAARPPQPGRRPAAATAHATGNPTFDAALPPELAERRQKVATVRGRLSGLISHIEAEHTGLLPILDDLDDDAATLKAAELFDPAAARKFLGDLHALVAALTPKDTKPKA